MDSYTKTLIINKLEKFIEYLQERETAIIDGVESFTKMHEKAILKDIANDLNECRLLIRDIAND